MKAPAWKSWPLPEPGTRLDDWQEGRCAWCGGGSGLYRLVEDHCHMTGLIRGLLCRGCNLKEGRAWDGGWEAWRAGDNPAFAIKHFEVYEGIHGTTISPRSNLRFYTFEERATWWEALLSNLAAGADWPLDAPLTEAAAARKEAEQKQVREAMDRFSAKLAEAMGGAA